MRERYTDPSSPEQAAFHEGFADLVALLSVFSLPGIVETIIDLQAPRRNPTQISKDLLTIEALRQSMLLKIYNLNDGKIVPERRRAQDDALNRYDTATKYHRNQGLSLHDAKLKAKADVVGYISGKEPYSAAVIDFLRLAHPQYF